MDIVYFLYIVKINEFSKFEKFTVIKLMKISFGDVRKDWLWRFTIGSKFNCKMVTDVCFDDMCSDAKFCMFVKSK